MSNPYKRMIIPFRWVWLAATAMAFLVVLEDYAGYLINGYEYAYSWFAVPAKALSNYWIWAILAPLISWQARKIAGRKPGNRSAKNLTSMVLGLLIALAHRVLAVSLFDLVIYLKSGFYANLFHEKNQQLIGTGWVSSSIQYGIILFLFFAVLYYQQYLQKQKELSQAQMRALKMQLHPHFLFNTLHSVASLIDIEPKAAQKMLSQLGSLMRSTLDQDEKESASLEEEIAYIKNYLDIEYVRFQDRLTVKYQLDETALQAKVPYLILQPLVENAIKHGLQHMQEDGLLTLEVRLLDEEVRLVITDNGTASGQKQVGSGLGLKNVARRLEAVFGDDFILEANPVSSGGFRVLIEFPFIKTSA